MFRKRARLAVQMIFKLFSELLHKSQRWHGRGIAKRAERAAYHVFGEVADVVDVLGCAEPRVEPRQRLLEPVRSFAAGDAPAAALVLIEADGAQREFDDAGLVVDDHHAARAE